MQLLQKPPEPEKKALDKELDKEVVQVKAPIAAPQLTRPPFETPMITLQAQISESLKANVQKSTIKTDAVDDG